jgi:hypothetical protein
LGFGSGWIGEIARARWVFLLLLSPPPPLALNRVYIEVTEGRREVNVDEISEVESPWPSATSM